MRAVVIGAALGIAGIVGAAWAQDDGTDRDLQPGSDLEPGSDLQASTTLDPAMAAMAPRDQFVGSFAPLVQADLPVVVGLVRTVTPPATTMPVSLVGLDAATLEERWRLTGMGDASVDAVHLRTHLVHAGGLVVAAQANRVVRGVDPADGTVRWTTPLTDVPTGACLHDDQVWVRVLDGEHRRIRPRDGQAESVKAWPDACGGPEAAQFELPSVGLEPAFPDLDSIELDGVPAGVVVDAVLRVPGSKDKVEGVALLHKSPGTSVPHVGATRGPRLLWERALDTRDPFAPMAEELEHVALAQGGEVALVAYQTRLGHARVHAFDRKTGQVRWDVAVPHPEHQAEALLVRGDRVYVSHWTYLEALDLKTGQATGSYGIW